MHRSDDRPESRPSKEKGKADAVGKIKEIKRQSCRDVVEGRHVVAVRKQLGLDRIDACTRSQRRWRIWRRMCEYGG